jgi:AcrR family transcriptional regulator
MATRRVRRTPEEARTHILDAADRVFARSLPDVVGLKEVARAAGVSHGLVTHYFGTYDALVRAALERRLTRLRDAIVGSVAAAVARGEDFDLLAEHRRAIEAATREPATVRLALWAVMSGYVDEEDFFPARMKGLKLLVDAIAERKQFPKAPRERIEAAIVAQTAFVVLWTFGGKALLAGLGRKHTPETRAAFDAELVEMLRLYLEASDET